MARSPGERLHIDALAQLLDSNEQWLMQRVLGYAQDLGYTVYTSTLEEAWRLSINGLSASLVESVRCNDGDLDIRCEADFSDDPAVAFGVLEARNHRARGVPFGMFLGLMKYYAQSYADLCETLPDAVEADACARMVARFFDRVEIAFATEWAGLGEQEAVQELQDRNRATTDEKVRYLTIFEALNVPVILVDEHGMLENINEAAARAFGIAPVSGSAYYSHVAVGEPFGPLESDVKAFLGTDMVEREFERKLKTVDGERIYVVRMKRMLEFSGAQRGVTIALHDITDRKHVQDSALQSRAQYRSLFENSVDAYAQHIATRDADGAIVDYVFAEVNPAFELLFGLSAADVIGRPVSEVWPPGNALCLD